jgi:phosphoenolpyruvate synthase/pyruvate phosphate dikinase
VDPSLVEAIRREIRRVAPEGRVRFRSSTNAEDLPGFSGAGLYTSKTVDLSDPHKTIERGLRAVWASVWNDGAFEEREMAGIREDRIAMAVLVHESFPDEAANGVAITRNLFTDWRPAYTVNVQAGESSVTNPDGESTPEQFLYYTWYERGPRVEYLARSSLTGGAPVLSVRELERLGRALGAIHDHFARWYGDRPGYAMDVEFKLVGPNRTLVVKQARPYVGTGC